MSTALVRSHVSMLTELRRGWISGRRVAVSVTNGRRFEGWVARVAATDSFVVLDVPEVELVKGKKRVRHHLMDVPTNLLLGIHNPSVLGDSNHEWVGPWRGPGYHPPPPQVERLFDPASLSTRAEVAA